MDSAAESPKHTHHRHASSESESMFCHNQTLYLMMALSSISSKQCSALTAEVVAEMRRAAVTQFCFFGIRFALLSLIGV